MSRLWYPDALMLTTRRIPAAVWGVGALLALSGCMQNGGEGSDDSAAGGGGSGSQGSGSGESSEGARGVDPARPSESDVKAATAAAAPVAEGDFCSTLTLHVCDALQNCCSSPERKFADRAECLSSIDGCFDYALPELDEPYDPAQAGGQLELFRRSAEECAIPYPRIMHDEVLEVASSDVAYPTSAPAFGSASASVSGAGPVGIAPVVVCSEVCDTGQYCADGTCAPQAGQGESCGESDQCVIGLECRYATTTASEQTCNPPPQRGEPCNNWAYCDDFELRCRPVAPGAQPYTCEGLGEDGEGCIGDADCVAELGCRSEDGTSAKACLPPGDEGDSCSTRVHCGDGLACNDRSCSACTNHSQCVQSIGSGYGYSVADDVCVEGRCRQSNEVFGAFADGATCFEHQHCKSGWCSSGICITPTPDELYCLPVD